MVYRMRFVYVSWVCFGDSDRISGFGCVVSRGDGWTTTDAIASTHSHDVAGVLINWINPSADVSTSSEGVENVHSGIPM